MALMTNGLRKRRSRVASGHGIRPEKRREDREQEIETLQEGQVSRRCTGRVQSGKQAGVNVKWEAALSTAVFATRHLAAKNGHSYYQMVSIAWHHCVLNQTQVTDLRQWVQLSFMI